MASLVLEQAVFDRPEWSAPTLRGRSAGFGDDWVEAAARLAVDFGVRPLDVRCPLAIFARPLTPQIVAVVRVTDGAAGLAFHFLAIRRSDYEQFLGDPFVLAEQMPVNWAATTWPTLTMPRQSRPRRTVEEVRAVLRRVKTAALRQGEDPESPEFERTADNSESPVLLGGAQILVDGGRLMFQRREGDLELLAGLWLLLPDRLQARLWPASFAFGNALGFDAVAVPRGDVDKFEGYASEEQAADYARGSYELALQIAAEAGDQDGLDRVFTRRGAGEVLRSALVLLVTVVAVVGLGRLFMPAPDLEVPAKAAVVAGIVASADPWTAFGLYEYAEMRWRPER